jgi:hypothetical protein
MHKLKLGNACGHERAMSANDKKATAPLGLGSRHHRFTRANIAQPSDSAVLFRVSGNDLCMIITGAIVKGEREETIAHLTSLLPLFFA